MAEMVIERNIGIRGSMDKLKSRTHTHRHDENISPTTRPDEGRPWVGLLSLLAIFLVLSGCTPRPENAPSTGNDEFHITPLTGLEAISLAPGQRLHVVATTSIVGDVVGQIGGEAIDLLVLMPLGVDPHTYEPVPRDIQAIAEADVVFLSGLGLEEALLPSLVNTGGKASFVSVSEGITPLGLGAAGTAESGQALSGLALEGVDPHVWQDPTNVVRWTENVAETLSRLDPAGADGYRQRSDAYHDELFQLDAEIRSAVASVPAGERKLVTDHDDMGYFAARYGFEIVGAMVPAYSTSAEPSAQEISKLEESVKWLGVKAVFVGVEANPALSRRVAQDTGVQLVPIYADSLSDAKGPAPNYIQLMQYNVKAIVDALS